MITSYITSSVEETEMWGKRLGQTLVPGDRLALLGNLGAGKTAFVRGVMEGLGTLDADVSSPTFAIMNEYLTEKAQVLHFDFYRFHDEAEIWTQLDLEGQFCDSKIIIAEWPDKISDFKLHFNRITSLEVLDSNRRLIQLNWNPFKS